MPLLAYLPTSSHYAAGGFGLNSAHTAALLGMRGLCTPFAALLLLPWLLGRFGPIGLVRRVTFFCAAAYPDLAD